MSTFQKRLDGLFRTNVSLAGNAAHIQEHLAGVNEEFVKDNIQIILDNYLSWQQDIQTCSDQIKENERPEAGVFRSLFENRIDELENRGRQIDSEFATVSAFLQQHSIQTPTKLSPGIEL